jgi:hypothetical protein
MQNDRVSYPRAIIKGLEELKVSIVLKGGSYFDSGRAAAYAQMLRDTVIPYQHCPKVAREVTAIIEEIKRVDDPNASSIIERLEGALIAVNQQYADYRVSKEPPLPQPVAGVHLHLVN